MVKIFVGRLSEDVTKAEIEELFKAFGEVTDCVTLKNYGFVHMADLEEAKAAIAGLDKHELHGNPINVEMSTTKVAKASKVFIGNLPPDTKSSEIHKLFKKYGTVIECDVVKNFAFVHMGKESMARDAIEALNGTTFNGNKIAVQMAKTRKSDDGFDGPQPGWQHPGDAWGGPMRGRGRGIMGMPPMRPPRFRGRPPMGDPFLQQGMARRGLRPRLPAMAGRGVAGLNDLYDREVLARGLARQEMLLRAGDPLVLRERAALARRLEVEAASYDSYGAGAGLGLGAAGNGASALDSGYDFTSGGAANIRMGLNSGYGKPATARLGGFGAGDRYGYSGY